MDSPSQVVHIRAPQILFKPFTEPHILFKAFYRAPAALGCFRMSLVVADGYKERFNM